MSLESSARPSTQASVAHQLLSPELMSEADMWHCLRACCHQGDILPFLFKGNGTTGALQSATSVQAGTVGHPLPSASRLPAVDMWKDIAAEPALLSVYLAQPAAFAYSES